MKAFKILISMLLAIGAGALIDNWATSLGVVLLIVSSDIWEKADE